MNGKSAGGGRSTGAKVTDSTTPRQAKLDGHYGETGRCPRAVAAMLVSHVDGVPENN